MADYTIIEKKEMGWKIQRIVQQSPNTGITATTKVYLKLNIPNFPKLFLIS